MRRLNRVTYRTLQQPFQAKGGPGVQEGAGHEHDERDRLLQLLQTEAAQAKHDHIMISALFVRKINLFSCVDFVHEFLHRLLQLYALLRAHGLVSVQDDP